MVSNELLRRDVRMLGDLLGSVITEQAGSSALELVEDVRQRARARRAGTPGAEAELVAKIVALSEAEARTVARAFSVFLDMSNLAEDRHRVRVLRQREVERAPEPISESIGAGIAQLKAAGFTAEQVQEAINRVSIDLVFTAHPSEAKRRSMRAKLRRMRHSLQELDRTDLLPRERQELVDQLRTELTILWQTEFLRPWRPTALQEVDRGLSISPRLWEVIPAVHAALRFALHTAYPDHTFELPVFLRFGSWMGGDRDGNPNVTADVTAQTLARLRESAIEQHLSHARTMFDFLSISVREIDIDPTLIQELVTAGRRWPALATELEAVAPREIYRRWITMLIWRLKQSLLVTLDAPLPEGAYRGGAEFEAELRQMCLSLRNHHGQLSLEVEVQKWLDLVRVFGLHLTRLDIRQDSRRHEQAFTEIFSKLGLAEKFEELPEPDRQALLTKTLSAPPELPVSELSELTQKTLKLFMVLRRAMEAYGQEVIGGHIISLTRFPSDMLSVLWFWNWALAQPDPHASAASSDQPLSAALRIMPLFEKIDDLERSPQTLGAILDHPAYRAYLHRQQNRQIVMVGYSDSTKDGGYLAACWGLYRAQQSLREVADEHQVKLTFFHGRGGSLGRGGGPAARGILSLPPAAHDGTLRLTEQGEVLAERYDDVQVAYRHLEQVTWATLVASALPAKTVPDEWPKLLDELSQRSLKAYRELVDWPGFIQFFADATPIEEIENLPIGSRPSRRRGERSLNDLRAIPWVFSWTQNRCLIPAWYGLGTAVGEVRDSSHEGFVALQTMYREWPFFQATIDNAALALAKADMPIARRYSDLAGDDSDRKKLWSLISSERDRTRLVLIDLTGGTELLSATPWLQSSIEVRNPYIDPINLIQIELLKRKRKMTDDTTPEFENLRDLLRLTVQGIAAGMRTTG